MPLNKKFPLWFWFTRRPFACWWFLRWLIVVVFVFQFLWVCPAPRKYLSNLPWQWLCLQYQMKLTAQTPLFLRNKNQQDALFYSQFILIINLYMFQAGLLLIIRRYFTVYSNWYVSRVYVGWLLAGLGRNWKPGSQISRQSAHECGKVVSCTRRLLYASGNIPGTHFC